MQKSIFLFVVVLLTANFLSAQVQTSVGGHVGINLAKLVGEEFNGDNVDTDSRTGFLFGAVAEFRFSDNIAVQPELNFIQKGYSEEFDFFGVTEEVELTLNYLEIPILFKGGASLGSNLRLDGLVGPSFGFGMGDAKGKVNSDEEDLDWEDDLGLKKFDFGVQIGGMVSFNVGSSAQLFVDGRYLLGLSNLFDDPQGDEKANNRGIAFSLGALFPLGGE
jgi:hypothetical protein